MDARLQMKQWAEGAVKFLETETDKQKEAANELFSKWAQIKAMCTDPSFDESKRITATSEIFLLKETTDAKYTVYKTTVLAEFAGKSARGK